jgi:hypothetical protein
VHDAKQLDAVTDVLHRDLAIGARRGAAAGGRDEAAVERGEVDAARSTQLASLGLASLGLASLGRASLELATLGIASLSSLGLAARTRSKRGSLRN